MPSSPTTHPLNEHVNHTLPVLVFVLHRPKLNPHWLIFGSASQQAPPCSFSCSQLPSRSFTTSPSPYVYQPCIPPGIYPQSLLAIFNFRMLLSSHTRNSSLGGQITCPCLISPYMSPAPSTVVSPSHILPLPLALAISTPRPIPSVCTWYSGFWGQNPHPTCSFDPGSPPHQLPHLHHPTCSFHSNC